MDVRRPPSVVMIEPGISSGFDGDEAVRAIVVRKGAAGTREVRIQGCGMLITAVPVTPRGIRLPDFDQSIWNGTAAVVENPTGYDDALTQGLSGMLASQVIVSVRNRAVTVNRPCGLGQGMRQIDQGLRGIAESSGSIWCVESRGLGAGGIAAIGWNSELLFQISHKNSTGMIRQSAATNSSLKRAAARENSAQSPTTASRPLREYGFANVSTRTKPHR